MRVATILNARAGMCLAYVTIALCLIQSAHAQDVVAISWNAKGLASIRFANMEFLSFGQLNLSRLILTNAHGGSQEASLQSTVRVDPSANTMAASFAWGAITTTVAPKHNELEISIAVKNNCSETITGLALEPLRLRLEQKPAEYDGSIPIIGDGISSPSILSLSSPQEAVVLSNQDPARPLSIGFPWAINRPVSTEFPLRIVTGKEPMYPDRTPFIDRPIPPGATDTYRLSLTFAGPGTKVADLVSALYQRFLQVFPARLNWPDRRPIGAVVLATANAGFPENPRGWFLDRSLNVFDKRGQSRFCSTLNTWANNSIAILRSMNAQGAITWDIEGEQYPHPTTYVGDPRLVTALAPEMAPCVDSYFKRFRGAGFRVGVTIRPQQLVRNASDQAATQQATADPVQTLSDKIEYAKHRWGATLFYIDSNGDPNFPLSANVIRQLYSLQPDVLLIPEHSNIFYYGVSAPYGELRRGVFSTSSLVRRVYPEAFRVLNTSDGSVAEHMDAIRAAVEAGDVVMFRAWFADPANELLRDITAEKSRSASYALEGRAQSR